MPADNQRSSKNIKFLKPKLRDGGRDIKPYFEVTEPSGNGYVGTGEELNRVWGRLSRIGFGKFHHDGADIETFKIRIEDDETVYIIEMRMGAVARSVMNALCSITPEKMQHNFIINLYWSKSHEKAVAFVGMGQDDEDKFLPLAWKSNWNDLSAMIKKINIPGQKPFSDFTDLNNYLKKDLAPVIALVDNYRTSGSFVVENVKTKPESVSSEHLGPDDDLPF